MNIRKTTFASLGVINRWNQVKMMYLYLPDDQKLI